MDHKVSSRLSAIRPAIQSSPSFFLLRLAASLSLWIFQRLSRARRSRTFADAHEFVDGEIQVFVAQQRRHGSFAAHRLQGDLGDEKIFLVIFRLGYALTEGIDDLRPPPEADAVFESRAVAVNHEQAEGLRVGAIDHLPIAPGFILILLIDDA